MSFARTLLLLVFLVFAATGCIENPVLTSPNDDVGITFDGLGDWVWIDKNQNGIQDSDESGYAGVLVSLHDCDGNFISSDITNDLGNYELDGYDSGDYMVHFTLPEGYAFTNMRADSNATLDSDVDPLTGFTTCITLVDSLPEPTIDAGIYPEVILLGCAHGKGYWKNHLDEVDELLSITLGEEDGEKSLVVSDTDIAYGVLQQHTYGEPSNGITKVYAHLLTAKLSIANGADGSEAEDAIAEADAFLSDHDWNDWDDLSHDERQLVQRMIGSFHVSSASDDCPDDEEEDE